MNVMGLIRKFAVVAALALAPAASFAGIFISVGFAPPALPVYTQPICPGDGYLWNPGYWAYGDDGYYWVPGVWVQPPTVGFLWTPGYWGWGGSAFIFHEGYWGQHVGFYGGINYGFGFGGVGFGGGEWRDGHFAYNTAVTNVNTTVIHNTYVNKTVINNTTINNNTHTSFNGGTGGIQARPTPQEQQAEHENHVPPTSVQQSHVQAARAIPANFAKTNGGHPAMAAIQRPGAMNTAVAARGAAPASRPANQPFNNNRPVNGNDAGRPNAVTQARPLGQAQAQTQTSRPGAQSGRAQTQAAQPGNQAARQQTETARPQQQYTPRPQQQQAARPQPQQQPRQQAPRPQPAARQQAPRPQSTPRSEPAEHGHGR